MLTVQLKTNTETDYIKPRDPSQKDIVWMAIEYYDLKMILNQGFKTQDE